MYIHYQEPYISSISHRRVERGFDMLRYSLLKRNIADCDNFLNELAQYTGFIVARHEVPLVVKSKSIKSSMAKACFSSVWVC
jgi:hypothetical protein